MYTIYDLEISREIVATLSYIALQSGIKLKNKNQFNYIIYKLYNYLKDDFTFENGITINEAIKEKINNFKTIHSDLYYPVASEDSEEYYCTFPKLAQNSSTAPYIDDEFITMEDVLASEDSLYKIPYKFWCNPKTSSDYCSVQIELKAKADGTTKKSVVYASRQSFTNLDYWELYIGLNTAKTAYSFTRKIYNTSGDLIKTETVNFGITTNPNLHNVRIYKVYGDYYPTECYKFVKGQAFDETDLLEIDTSNLTIGDLYYAKDLYQPTSSSEITFDSLLQKHLNGEFIGSIYGILPTYLGGICQYDKNVFKFLTITANAEKTSYTGYVSTYPLYATNVNSELGLWFLNTSDNIPVKVFKSENGEIWDELKTISGFTYNTDAFVINSKALSYTGEDIIYSNYPVYYSLAGTNFEISLLDETEQELLLNDEGIPYSLEEDNTFKLYRNADEDFTLDMLPLGASFYYGKHKIEDSPRFKLVFRPMDYSNNINTAYGSDNWLPKDTVYCDSVHIIDALAFHNVKNYYNEAILYKNSHLPRWLNSDAPEGQWWTAINEYDTPSTEENMYNSTVSKGYEFGHRAGFLHHFTLEEKSLLKSFEYIPNYEGQKVIFMESYEAPSSYTKTYRPKLFKACGASTVGVLRPYWVKELKYHKNSDISIACATSKNEFVSTYNYSFFWCRNKGANLGQYADFTVNGTVAYYGRGVKPLVCLDKNVKIKREPDEYGIFSLDLPTVETIDVDLHFETERKIAKNTEKSFETKLSILNNIENRFDTIRTIGVSDVRVFDVIRNIQVKSQNKYETKRDIASEIIKTFPTNRVCNYFYNFRFPTELKIIRDIEKQYPLLRNVREEYSVIEKFNLKRDVLENTTVRFKGLERYVLGSILTSYPLQRKIRENILKQFETEYRVVLEQIFSNDCERKIVENIEEDFNTNRKTCVNIFDEFDIVRDIYEQEVLTYGLDRRVMKNIETLFDIDRRIENNIKAVFDTFRYIAKKETFKFNTNRNVIENSKNIFEIMRAIEIIEPTILDFDIIRNIIESEEFIANSERRILENFTGNSDTCRELLNNFNSTSDIMRNITENVEVFAPTDLRFVHDIFVENLTLRKVLEIMENEHPTKRTISSNNDKYVSKANLMLYTALLKEEINTLIDARITRAFAERNL